MKRRKRIYIKFKKERVILSDTLPFEIPLIFSNRFFYEYLLRSRISLSFNGENEAKIRLSKHVTSANKELVKLLFGISKETDFDTSNEIKIGNFNAIPFNYKISHKENDYRELSIAHPKNQLHMVYFYDRFKELILHYCSISPFSIRKPHRIARYTFHSDRLHLQKLAEPNDEIIEENHMEYENLKTFFVYKKYSNIHKFYESYQYHRAEKKFNKLLKFDISKCFDSIYTHSLTWAILNKEEVKRYMSRSVSTFGDKFDSVIRYLNYNETNGIVIGPEFSRIFAELLLQKIDVNVKQELLLLGIHNKKDYDVFRYVDDYFIFYNDETCLDKVLAIFKHRLKDYRFYFNESKTILYDKPIITGISIAKQQISHLFNEQIGYVLTEIQESQTGALGEGKGYEGTIYLNSNRTITQFKTILYESKVEYKDILNYTLVILERKIKQIFKQYFKIRKKKDSESQFIHAVLEFLDIVFFLYSVSPKVNTTIKLCRILRHVIELLRFHKRFRSDFKHLIYKKIYDNVAFILQKNRSARYTQVETLYLLIILGELGANYWLTQDVLATYLGIERVGGVYTTDMELGYFAIIVSLFYMKAKVRFDELRTFIIDRVEVMFKTEDYDRRLLRSEFVHLLLDILTYPYTDIAATKNRILALYGITDPGLQNEIIAERKYWFTNWSDFKFGFELDAKQSQEVY